MTLLAAALDTPETDVAESWARQLGPLVDVLKIGLELFWSAGPDAVRRVREAGEKPIFLDAKLDDIPKTVAGAARAAARLDIAWLTVHIGAGEDACRAAVEAVREGAPGDPPKVLGVTLLTSLGPDDLAGLGLSAELEEVIASRAALAAAVGMDGVVCAGRDQPVVARVAPSLLRVVPGVRPSSADDDDQARVTTAAEAAAGGAAMVVVGRPITAVADPVQSARSLRGELSGR